MCTQSSMRDARLILLMGADATLLDLRSRVLEAAGFAVARATSVPEIKEVLKERHVALLLLCHTLTVYDCQRAMAAVHEVDPEIITIVLATFSGRTPIQNRNVVVHQMSGPQKLVQTVRGILG
jgi:DNA-binding NtrC family response regulator